jgi:ubiquitin C-terminal hydrolase
MIIDSLVTCNKCGHVSKKKNNVERLLSLPIQPKTKEGTIEACLERYMIEKVHDYKCAKCDDKSIKHRVQHIIHTPEVLVIQLKRFKYDGNKDCLPVKFGPTLSLARYCANPRMGHLNYELTAVIKHAGGLTSGHYRCVAKDSDSSWHDFDDSKMYEADIGEATDPGRERCNPWTPYIIFYRRQ